MRNFTAFLLFLLGLSSSTVGLAADDFTFSSPPVSLADPNLSNNFPQILPAEDAFALSAIIELPNTLIVMWDIKEGYYLYKKSLSFNQFNGPPLGNAQIPAGESISDEYFGLVDVFYNKLLIKIPFDANTAENEISLQLEYQGCAEAGFCYPMQQKQLTLETH